MTKTDCREEAARLRGFEEPSAVYDLWGYGNLVCDFANSFTVRFLIQSFDQEDAARAFLLAITSEGWHGHEVFCPSRCCLRASHGSSDADVLGRDIATDDAYTSMELKQKYWPKVAIRQADWWRDAPQRGFFDCSKAERLLGWTHV